MKRYIRSNDDKLQKAYSIAKELREKKIGHAGYPETYGECRVQNHDGKWVKGKFTESARDGSWFRVRTWGAGVGAYTERNYSIEDIEFM
jgi:hypothetical protein